MRILLTGGSGFIGRHVLPRLLARGHSVLAVERKRKLPKGKGLETVRGNIRRAVFAFKPQACLHLAWDGIGDYSYARSKRNLDDSLALVELLREAKCKRLVAAGSCWEYGVSRGVCREDMPAKSVSAFTWAKNALHDYARLALPEVLWCRVFFVYGPGQRETSLIPSLLAARARGEAPVVRNPLDAQDFVHVEDVADGLIRALERKAPSGGYNLGSGRSTRVSEVARLVARWALKADKNEREGPAVDFRADTRKSRNALGWKPRITLTEGIANMSRDA